MHRAVCAVDGLLPLALKFSPFCVPLLAHASRLLPVSGVAVRSVGGGSCALWVLACLH
ncbi:hypothetical protein TPADAL_0705a [Treponema pallidum subsp. pallidum DAL-1]|nr:hypothetical protein TPADAL_0705a [Treponema pallidum subsp. pallidum DAL-1]